MAAFQLVLECFSGDEQIPGHDADDKDERKREGVLDTVGERRAGVHGSLLHPIVTDDNLRIEIKANDVQPTVFGRFSFGYLTAAYAQYDLAEDMTLRKPFVRSRGLVERVQRGNRYLEARGLDGSPQPFDLSDARRRVV